MMHVQRLSEVDAVEGLETQVRGVYENTRSESAHAD